LAIIGDGSAKIRLRSSSDKFKGGAKDSFLFPLVAGNNKRVVNTIEPNIAINKTTPANKNGKYQ
jgi:hypothetical protein